MLALVASLLVTACGSSSPSPTGSGAIDPGPGRTPDLEGGIIPDPGIPTPPTASGATDPGGPAFPGRGGMGDGTLTALPADVVAAANAIVDAPTREAASAATRKALEASGVVVSDDPTTVRRSLAGLGVAPEELDAMARLARSRATTSLVTFAEFATTFGGMALLPPNEAALAVTDPNASIRLDLGDQPIRQSKALTTWVQAALRAHDPTDPQVAAVTTPALLLAALAQRQIDPVDIASGFRADDLRLGPLDVTLLAAGLRASLAVAKSRATAFDDRPRTARTTSASLARFIATSPGRPVLISPPAAPDPCTAFKEAVDAHVPFATDIFAVAYGNAVQTIAEEAAKAFLGENIVSSNVSNAFNIAGIVFRFIALVVLYQNAEAKLEITPTEVHKPLDRPADLISAHVEAGVPDELWEEAKQARQASPYLTAARMCLRLHGLPTMTDAVDVGDAVKNWRVSWDLPTGSPDHAYFTGDQFLGAGGVASRLERPLQQKDDHTGQDDVTVTIKPERREDHPGSEQRRRVVVCAKVRMVEPPSVQDLLNAGVAGTPVGGVTQLAAVIANLLAGWAQFANTLDECAHAQVTFHVQQAGAWRGTVTVNALRNTSETSLAVGVLGPQDTQIEHNGYLSDITDEYYVSGDDDPARSGMNFLTARQFTRGVAEVNTSTDRVTHRGTGCTLHDVTEQAYNGSWSFDTKSSVVLQVGGDGSYTITVRSDQNGAPEPLLPGNTTRTITGCSTNRHELNDAEMIALDVVATTESISVDGEFDPADPNPRLHGGIEVADPNRDLVVTITWDLTHTGPVPAPRP